MNVLAFSSSRSGNGGFLEKALPLIQSFLGEHSITIAFIPFASVQKDYDEYGGMVLAALAATLYKVEIVKPGNAKDVIERAGAIMVGGGNTFKLIHDIYALGLLELIQQKVRAGTPYIGWSAGANISGKSICTTNDMPIVQPASFTAFGFLPFQINPHYINIVQEGFNGETRDQRLEEFMRMNPDVTVFGLPEGTALLLREGKLQYIGAEEGVLFLNKEGVVQKEYIKDNEYVSQLM